MFLACISKNAIGSASSFRIFYTLDHINYEFQIDKMNLKRVPSDIWTHFEEINCICSRKSGLFVYNPEVFIQTLPSLELSGLQDTWKVKTLACTYTVLYIVLKGVPDFGDIVQWGAPLDLDPNLLLFSSLLQSTTWETYSKQKAKNIERSGEIRNYSE